MIELLHPPCVRGCIQPRTHAAECDHDGCHGCGPRRAEHGQLCTPCHRRLLNLIDNAAGQRDLLLAYAPRALTHDLTAETEAKISTAPRLSAWADFPGMYARRRTTASEGTEPLDLARIDSARDLADLISTLVERVVDEHDRLGPKRLTSRAERDNPRRLVWREANEYRRTSGYEWVEPPERFEIHDACRWLAANIADLEASEAVGDDMEELSEAMSAAHSLAPWREQVARLDGIECPECHARSLARFGGDDFVTCLRCKATMSEARYAIWTRMLTEERA